MADVLQAVVTSAEDLGSGIFSFELAPAQGGEFPAFTAGSHIEVHAAPGLTRPYSLCGAPGRPGTYRLGILREESRGGASDLICSRWRTGTKVDISAPRNLFPLVETAMKSILIGGGIGITPLLAMAHRLTEIRRPFELHYCISTREKAAFERIAAEAGVGDQMKVHCSAERRFDFAEDVGTLRPAQHLYVCGPQGFMHHVIGAAREARWMDRQIHFEYFDVEADLSGAAFTAVLVDGTRIEIPANVPATTVLREAGCKVDVSCEKGICGSCVTRVLKGTPDHRDNYLTDEEKERGDSIALCCSRAVGGELVLDLARVQV